MNKKIHKKLLISGVIVTLTFLPGCALVDMFKGSNERTIVETGNTDKRADMTGEVLVTLKGRPVVTVDSMEKKKEEFFKGNPQLKSALAVMEPQVLKSFERNLLDSIIGQCVLQEYIVSNKINQSTAYKAEQKDLYEAMDRFLDAKFFGESLAVKVTEADAKAYYEANKDQLRGVTLSQGGVASMGIEFPDAQSARAFMMKAKQVSFKKAANDEGLNGKIKDFKLVNAQSIGMDEALRDNIVAIKTVPSVEMIEANGTYWVVAATAKEESKYIPYEQIKDQLKQQLEKAKREEIGTQELETLKKKYGVIVNEDYFKPTQASSEEQDTSARGSVLANESEVKNIRTTQLA